MILVIICIELKLNTYQSFYKQKLTKILTHNNNIQKMKPDFIKSCILEAIQKVALDKNKIDQFRKSNQFSKTQPGKTLNYYQNCLLVKQQYIKALSSLTRMQQLLTAIKQIDLTKGKTSQQNILARANALIDEINSYSIQLNVLKQYHDNQKPYLEHGIKSINACRAYLNGLIQSSISILQSVQKITNSFKTNQKRKSNTLNVEFRKSQKKEIQIGYNPFEIIKSINVLALQIEKEITLFFSKEFPNKLISPNRNVILYPPSFLSFHYYKDFKTFITKLQQNNQLILEVKNLQAENTKEYCTNLQNFIQRINKDFESLNNIDKSVYKEPQQQILNHLKNLQDKFFKIIELKSRLDQSLVKSEQKKQTVDNSPLKSSRNSSMKSQTGIRETEPQSEKKIMMDNQQQSKINIKNTIQQASQNPQISKILDITSEVKKLILLIEDKNKQVKGQNMYVNKIQLNKMKLQNSQVEQNILSLFDKLYNQKPNRSKLRTQSMEQKQGSKEQKHKSSEDFSEQYELMLSKKDYQKQIQKRLNEFEKNLYNQHTKKINHLKNQYEDKISKIKEQIKKFYEDKISVIQIEYQIKQQQYKTQMSKIAELRTKLDEANNSLTKRNEDINNRGTKLIDNQYNTINSVPIQQFLKNQQTKFSQQLINNKSLIEQLKEQQSQQSKKKQKQFLSLQQKNKQLLNIIQEINKISSNFKQQRDHYFNEYSSTRNKLQQQRFVLERINSLLADYNNRKRRAIEVQDKQIKGNVFTHVLKTLQSNESQISELKNQIQTLNNQISSQKKTIQQLKAQLNDINIFMKGITEIKEAEKILQQKQKLKQVEKFESVVDSSKNFFYQIISRIASHIQQKKKQTDKKEQDLISTLQQSKKDVFSLQQQLNSTQTQLTLQHQKTSTLTTQLQRLNKTFHESLTRNGQQLAQLKSQKQSIEKKNEMLESMLKQRQLHVQEQEEEIEELQTKIKEMQTKSKVLQDKIKEMRKKGRLSLTAITTTEGDEEQQRREIEFQLMRAELTRRNQMEIQLNAKIKQMQKEIEGLKSSKV